TPGRLCQRWSGKLTISCTSFSAGPSVSAILRASSGVRRFMVHLRCNRLVDRSKAENCYGASADQVFTKRSRQPILPRLVEGCASVEMPYGGFVGQAESFQFATRQLSLGNAVDSSPIQVPRLRPADEFFLRQVKSPGLIAFREVHGEFF